MDEQYKELSRRADKGDSDALRELFALGKQLEEEGKYREAAAVFRDAAIAYRISAFRNKAFTENTADHSEWYLAKLDIYKKWIERNPNGFRKLPYSAPGITREIIRKVVVDQLWKDDSFMPLFSFVGESLAAIGVKFFSPGGSIQRHVWLLLVEIFGVEEGMKSAGIRHPAVRIGLDTFADEVMKRYQSPQQDDPRETRLPDWFMRLESQQE